MQARRLRYRFFKASQKALSVRIVEPSNFHRPTQGRTPGDNNAASNSKWRAWPGLLKTHPILHRGLITAWGKTPPYKLHWRKLYKSTSLKYRKVAPITSDLKWRAWPPPYSVFTAIYFQIAEVCAAEDVEATNYEMTNHLDVIKQVIVRVRLSSSGFRI